MIREIILSLTLTSLISSLVLTLPHSRGQKEIIKMICGIVIIINVIIPIKNNLPNVDFSFNFTNNQEESFDNIYNEYIKKSISDNISNTATSLGINCSIEFDLKEDFNIENVVIYSDDNIDSLVAVLQKDYNVENIRQVKTNG